MSAFAKMPEDKKAVGGSKLSLSKEMHLGFLESMSKTNTEKITREILEGLSKDTGPKRLLIGLTFCPIYLNFDLRYYF